ncbi:MAG: SprB repeat-containing protein [Saprospiraceae bacterium]|nr:SprB repeat-containing protein [Candidatus Brachybacter algidus]
MPVFLPVYAADQVVTVRIGTVTADVNNVTCNGAHDGSITAHSDGVAPFTYDWNTEIILKLYQVSHQEPIQ